MEYHSHTGLDAATILYKDTRGYAFPTVYKVSDNIKASDLDEESTTSRVAPVTLKQIQLFRVGDIRVDFTFKATHQFCNFYLYRNSTEIALYITSDDGDYHPNTWYTVSNDVEVQECDIIYIKAKCFDLGMECFVKDAKYQWDLQTLTYFAI